MPWILTRMIMKDQEFEVFFERGIAADDIQKLFQFMVPLIPLYGSPERCSVGSSPSKSGRTNQLKRHYIAERVNDLLELL
jgi:hypothetical protein